MQKHYTFEDFLLERWGEAADGPGREEKRQKAFQRFWKEVRHKKVASRQTVKKWFSLAGRSVPSRNHILRIAMALHLSVEETEQYLKYGISDSELQVNDYMEFAAMYCLDHQLDYSEYEAIIEFYEQETDDGREVHQSTHTDRILKQYETVRNYGRDDFLVWMCKNAKLFKGYSRVTYKLFCSLLKESRHFFRAEVKDSLWQTLSLNTDFFDWCSEQGIPEEERENAIPRYVKNRKRGKHRSLDEKWQNEIRSLYVLAYSSRDRFCDLLTALGTKPEEGGKNKEKGKAEGWEDIGIKSKKYISELLWVSLQKKKEMDLRRQLLRLKKQEEEGEPVSNERRKVRRELTMQTQRVHTVTRSDLLLLIQYVSGERYKKEIKENRSGFDPEEAKRQFVEFSNTVLDGCGMRPLDERYRLDANLLACFEGDDVKLLAEKLEEESW